jgi:replication factor C small subunit
MWTEKYRPLRIDDIINQKATVDKLKSIIKSPRNMPHLLFTGPPGTGKTTSALCISSSILGDYWRDFTLELNASDERGINTVRDRVKTFAMYTDRRENVPFRIIILDEADEMTNDAQTALRRIMETYSRVTRFILIGNYSSRIIEPQIQ